MIDSNLNLKAMKARKIFIAFIAVIMFSGFQTLNAQTFQQEVSGIVVNEYVGCLNKQLSGEWVYHMTYHLDKNGIMTNFHWNVRSSDLVDSEGNRYKYIDTGNDDLGVMWDIFNNLTAYNEGYNITYNVEDGWMPVPDAGNMPVEGRLVNSIFTFKGKKGEKVTWTVYYRIKLDNNGEIKMEIFKEEMNCN